MLETSKVFIDTEYYRKKEFNFNNTSFKKFQTLCENDEFQLYITTVVKQEVQRQLKGKVGDVQKIIKDFTRKRHILEMMSDINIDNILMLGEHTSLEKRAIQQFGDYLESCDCVLIESDTVTIDEVLELYFNQKAPFSKGKKDEFPDAISLLSIENHIDDSIYIISGDPDLMNYCKNKNDFIYIESLESLLDIYNEHLENVRPSKIKDYLSLNSSELEILITEKVEACEAYNFSAWEDTELEYFTIVSIEVTTPNLITVDEDYALVNFDVNIEFEVAVQGNDYDSAYHDKEDEKYYFLEKITIIDYVTKSLTIEVELIYPDSIESIEIDSVYVSCKNGLRFEIDQNSEYSY